MNPFRKNHVGTLNEAVRTAWIAARLAQLPAGWRLLDAGAGEKKYRRYCDHLVYVAQDFGQYDGQGDARGLQTGCWDQTDLDIVSDITAIPQPDGAFDAILCIEVFEHLPDPLAALREFSRLIKTGGELILSAPFCSLTHFAPYHFYSGFNSYFYEKYLPEFGFEIRELKHNGNFFEYLAQEIRRLPTMSQKFAGNRMQRWLRLIMWPMLFILGILAKHDSGSDETLCFGFQVYAVKKG